MAQSSELSDALALEAIEFNQSLRDTAYELQSEVKALEHEMMAKGLYFSGHRYVREMEIRFKRVEHLVHRVITKRKEVGRRVPDLLTPALLNQLKAKLDPYVDAAITAELNRAEPGSPSPALHQQARQEGARLQGMLAQELAQLALEARLGMHNEEKQMIFNISNSTIASLNLGTVVGDLTASVQNLSGQGQQELANTIQTLAEALAACVELQHDQQKELLEHLSVVSAQLALPGEQRKMGPLRSSITALREGIADVTQLAVLWPPVEKLLKTMGILS